MDLKKHIIDTIKEWQLKIGYREGNMKLYYPGESLAEMLGIIENTTMEAVADRKCEWKGLTEESLQERVVEALNKFCDEVEAQLGRIKISGNYERFCLDIPPKGCAYVAGKVEEPKFLKLFLAEVTNIGNTIKQIRDCFAAYATEHQTLYREEEIAEEHSTDTNQEEICEEHTENHNHIGHAFYFVDEAVEEYVYWVEENEFGLTYHRFTRADYERLKR